MAEREIYPTDIVITDKQKKQWIHDELNNGTPAARRWADYRMKNGEDFADFEDDYLEIVFTECKLYETMKDTLCHHIQLHGLNRMAEEYFQEFKQVKIYNHHVYTKILKKVRSRFVQEGGNRQLEYLISKINEYIQKVEELSRIAFQMLKEGKSPDLEVWSDKAILQDAVFEENKQFLKQTLNHLNALQKNRCQMGVNEIRLLLYSKQGCRREKLYRQTEAWIIDIYNSLPSEEQRRSIYREICEFVAEQVPLIGYISPSIISFIFDRGFLSEMSRDLLVKIKPVISSLGMVSLILTPLRNFYDTALLHLYGHYGFTESDKFSIEIMKLYSPKSVSAEVDNKLQQEIKRQKAHASA